MVSLEVHVPRRFLALSQQYDKQGICSASRKFQKIKINEAKSDDSVSLEKFLKKLACVLVYQLLLL